MEIKRRSKKNLKFGEAYQLPLMIKEPKPLPTTYQPKQINSIALPDNLMESIRAKASGLSLREYQELNG